MFKVDQPVWCVMFGKGVVTRIINTDDTYPLLVEFPGKRVEVYTLDGKFRPDARQALFPYPVEVVMKVTKPSINWEHVTHKFKFLLKDIGGEYWLYEEKPIKTTGGWKYINGDYTPAEGFISFIPGNCDWKDSLVERPD